MVQCQNCRNQVNPTRNIAWLLAGFLLIVFWPAAFLYFLTRAKNICPICHIPVQAPRPREPQQHKTSYTPILQWERKTWLKIFGALGAIIVIILVVTAITPDSEEELAEKSAKRAAEAAEKAEERRKGFHCLSQSTGRHYDMEWLIKDKLRDPGSFEEVETWISPADNVGKHFVEVEYRARNAFGGMVFGIATGFINTETCKAHGVVIS